jgi:hypothetical protein
MSTLKTNNIANVAGTATTDVLNVINGSAKAWVNWNGQGTVAIRASYNVTSITDGGTGQYTVNMTSAMADANYSAIATCSARPDGGDAGAINFNYQNTNGMTSSSFAVVGPKTPGTTIQDGLIYCVAVFR